jgi:hypothetical protein
VSTYEKAKRAAMASALATGREGVVRVALTEDEGSGYAINTRAFYEEACSESDFIGQAWTYKDDNGKLCAAWED